MLPPERASIAFTCWTVIVLVVTMVYSAILVQLFRNRHKTPFMNTFYQITFRLGIADVSTIIYSFLWCRQKFHLFPDTLTAMMSDNVQMIFFGCQSECTVYFLHVQIIGVILVVMNRYTIKCRPFTHTMVGEYCYYFLFDFHSYGAQSDCALLLRVNGVFRCSHPVGVF
jgi:hypothetical protein